MTRLVDTHIHLTADKYADDLDAVLQRSRDAGVDRWISIGTDADDGLAARLLSDAHEGLFFACAFHPHEASHWRPEHAPRLRELLDHPKAVALGEIGLDYHYDFAPRDVQRRAFEEQIALAGELDLPIVIHCREAFEDIAAVLRANRSDRLRGVVHCFSEGPAEAERLAELGFHLGLGGVLTFPRSDAVREAARVAPRELLLLETDAPYLAPPPHRGKRNEPAYVPRIAEVLATTLGVTPDEAARLTSENAARLFGRGDFAP